MNFAQIAAALTNVEEQTEQGSLAATQLCDLAEILNQVADSDADAVLNATGHLMFERNRDGSGTLNLTLHLLDHGADDFPTDEFDPDDTVGDDWEDMT